MVIHTQGASELTSAVAAKFTYGMYGSGTQLEAFTDTALVSSITSSQKALTQTISGASILLSHELTAADANSTTLAEFELSSGTSTPMTRKTTTQLQKTSSMNVATTQVIFIDYN